MKKITLSNTPAAYRLKYATHINGAYRRLDMRKTSHKVLAEKHGLFLIDVKNKKVHSKVM